jgi:hypothetical protein
MSKAFQVIRALVSADMMWLRNAMIASRMVL